MTRALDSVILFVLPWFLALIIGIAFLLMFVYLAHRVFYWRRKVHHAHDNNHLPDDVAKQLEEFKEYKKKYLVKSIAILFVLFSFFSFNTVFAQTKEIAPPLIDTISHDISNKEIFYIGGKTNIGDGEVVLYIQNLNTGETISYNLLSNENGEWFYRHNKFTIRGRICTLGAEHSGGDAEAHHLRRSGFL